MRTTGIVALVLASTLCQQAVGAIWNIADGLTHEISAANMPIDTEIRVYDGPESARTTVSIFGGTITPPLSLHAFDHSMVNFFDGSVEGGIASHDAAIINLFGGQIGGESHVEGNGTLNIFGGEYGGGWVWDDAHVNIFGGILRRRITSVGRPSINVAGGTLIGILELGESTTAFITGGDIVGGLYPQGDAVVTILGRHFTLDGTPLSPGLFRNLEGYLDVTYSDGSSSGFPIRAFDSATVNLILPEPTTISVILLPASLTLALRPRRR